MTDAERQALADLIDAAKRVGDVDIPDDESED